MEAPICQRVPSCNTRHWPRQDCPNDAVVKPIKQVKPAQIVSKSKLVTNKPIVVTNTPDKLVTNKRTGNRHNKEKQRAYMRDYMKKHRAKSG